MENRPPKSVIISTVVAVLLTLILFGFLNASFVVIREDDDSDFFYDDGAMGAYSVSTQFNILERLFDVKSDVRFTYLFRSLL